MTPDHWIVTCLLAALVVAVILYLVLLGKFDRARAKASDADARSMLLQAEVQLLTEALEKRDRRLAELHGLQAILREEEAPDPLRSLKLQAFDALEWLARAGYGPSFTQGALHASQSIEVYGPGSADFAGVVVRMATRRGSRPPSPEAESILRAAGLPVSRA